MRGRSQPELRPAPIQEAQPDAGDLIAPHGRVTPARVRVLQALLAAPSALSHQDLERLLGGEIDRVTLYRVLDWLLTKGLAHRLAGDDRLWRFSANRQTSMGHEHAHFHCRRCGRWYCLEAPKPVYTLSLPAGFRAEQDELTLRGLCSACSA
jgi:Fur family ferric uptake transcriptional regulator